MNIRSWALKSCSTDVFTLCSKPMIGDKQTRSKSPATPHCHRAIFWPPPLLLRVNCYSIYSMTKYCMFGHWDVLEHSKNITSGDLQNYTDYQSQIFIGLAWEWTWNCAPSFVLAWTNRFKALSNWWEAKLLYFTKKLRFYTCGWNVSVVPRRLWISGNNYLHRDIFWNDYVQYAGKANSN